MLSTVLKDIEKQFKKKNKGIIFNIDKQCDFIPSGSVVIDMNMGGGLASPGRLVELFSFESGGKTTLALQTAKEAINKYPDKVVIFMDNEGHVDYTYVKSLGLKIGDNLQIFQPDDAEQTEQLLKTLIEKLGNKISLVIIDSVAACRPSAMMDHVFGESGQKSQHASFWSEFSPKINTWARKHDIAFLLVNQLRAKPKIGNMAQFSIGNTGMGAGFSNTDTDFNTTGGTALKYYLSARYLLRHVSDVKEQTENEVTGELEDVKVAKKYKIQNVKNKLVPPHRESYYVIRYGEGTDDAILIQQILQKAGIITTKGSFIEYHSSDKSLDFKENGKVRFAKRFNTPEILEDAKKQYKSLYEGTTLKIEHDGDDILDENIEEQFEV